MFCLSWCKWKYLRWSNILYFCQINDDAFWKSDFRSLYMGTRVHPLHWKQGQTNNIMEDFGYLQFTETRYCWCTSPSQTCCTLVELKHLHPQPPPIPIWQSAIPRIPPQGGANTPYSTLGRKALKTPDLRMNRLIIFRNLQSNLTGVSSN